MPIPTPKKNEKKSDFISRCMSALSDEFEDNEQRSAVCHQQWKKSKDDAAVKKIFNVCNDCNDLGDE